MSIESIFNEYGKKPNEKIIDFVEECRNDLDNLSFNEALFRYEQESQEIEELENFFKSNADKLKISNPTTGTTTFNRSFLLTIELNLAKYRNGQRQYKRIEKDWIFKTSKTFFELLKRYHLSDNKRYILMAKIYFDSQIYFFHGKNGDILNPYDIYDQELIKTQFKRHFLKNR